MPLSIRSAGLIRALLYPVLFESDPVNGVDRVMNAIVTDSGPGFMPEDFIAAIREALASDEPLTEILPQNHSEDAIRRFLAEVARRLENRLTNDRR